MHTTSASLPSSSQSICAQRAAACVHDRTFLPFVLKTGRFNCGSSLVYDVVQAVPYDLSLAAVRQYIWKRSDDPVLHYGRQTVGRPAPMPTMKPVS